MQDADPAKAHEDELMCFGIINGRSTEWIT